MRSIALTITAALLLMVLSTDGFAKPPRKVARSSSPSIPLTDCETITQPGNYVLENDLVLPLVYSGGEGGNGDCLVVNSSQVNVDLNGHTITTSCSLPGGPPFCPFFQGGAGIDIEADHVSITNGSVGQGNGGFVYGLIADADHISATNLNITTDVGIVLNDVSFSTFTNIDYEGADLQEHAENGPVLSVSGGGNNIFVSIDSKSSTFDGIILTNSSNNTVAAADIVCTAEEEAGPGILLTQGSSRNFLTENNIFVLFGNGIEVDSGSGHNVILNNTVEIETTPPGFFAMLDENSKCGSDFWIHNDFTNAFQPGQISASPASCIH